MNRRSFITKALAGLAAVPVLGKLVQAKPQLPPVYPGPLEYGEVKYVVGKPPMSFALCEGPVSRVARITISREAADRIDLERDRIAVNGESYEIVAASRGLSETTFDLSSVQQRQMHDPSTCWVCRTG